MSQSSLTFSQKVFLVVGVPFILLLTLEGICRVFNTPALFQSAKQPQALEMPTWMLREENVARRATRARLDPTALEWLTLFEEAQSFRVRLLPSTQRWVTNTFSLIPYDQQRKYLIQSNSLGFRGSEINPHKSPGTFRILIFGDSSSFGWGVNQDESYAALLPSYLENKNTSTRVEVGNFSIPGDSSEYGRLIAEHFLPEYAPDLVILGFGANDAKLVTRPHKQEVDTFREGQTGVLASIRKQAERSALFRTLVSITAAGKEENSQSKSNAEPKQRRSAVPPKRFRENLRAMASDGLSAGATQVLLLSLCTPNSYSRAARKLAQVHDWLFLNGQGLLLHAASELRKGNVALTASQNEILGDMQQHYSHFLRRDRRFYVTSDGCHPNAMGHSLVAQKIAEIIQPWVKP